MKKIIVGLLVFVVVLGANVYASASVDVTITGSVNGYVNTDLDGQNIILSLNNDHVFYDVTDGSDVTSWFNYDSNLPSGFVATATTVAGNQMTVNFTGQHNSEVNDYIKVKIPKEKINPADCLNDVVSIDSEEAKYIIVDNGVEVYYKQEYTVSGTVGQELVPQDIVVILDGSDSLGFAYRITPTEINTINGLTATITTCSINGKEITITYTGTPISESHDLIHTTLSKDIMSVGVFDRIVPDRVDVLFDINPIVNDCVIEDEPTSYIPPITGIE